MRVVRASSQLGAAISSKDHFRFSLCGCCCCALVVDPVRASEAWMDVGA